MSEKVCSRCEISQSTLTSHAKFLDDEPNIIGSRGICRHCLESSELDERLNIEQWIHEDLPMLTGNKPKPIPTSN